MKVSLITVTYNSAATVAETIESVLAQKYRDIEYIVVDGKSTDGTVEIIESYGSRISKFISEPDRGLYDALNKGIALATGDVVGIIHSDDVLAADDVIQTVVEAFTSFETDSVYGDLLYIDKNDPDKVIRYWQAGRFERKKMARGWMPPHPTFYVRREVYLRHGGFNTDYRISADYDFMVRMLHKKNIRTMHIPVIMVKMKIGGASNRSVRNILRKTMEDIRAMKENDMNFITGIINKNLSKVRQLFPSVKSNGQISVNITKS